MLVKCNLSRFLVLEFIVLPLIFALPDQGRWTFTMNQNAPYIGVPKSLYKDSVVSISVACTPAKDDTNIIIGWILRQTPCYEEYLSPQLIEAFHLYHTCPNSVFGSSYDAIRYLKSNLSLEKCTHTIDLKPPSTGFELHKTSQYEKCSEAEFQREFQSVQKRELNIPLEMGKPTPETLPKPQPLKENEHTDGKPNSHVDPTKSKDTRKQSESKTSTEKTVPKKETKKEESSQVRPIVSSQDSDNLVSIDQDGVYLLIVFISLPNDEGRNFTATVDIKMKGTHGYLSAVDWPLLPFYGVMCGIYVVYAIVWLTVSALQWRDLLRIQFWIGGVIFLGLVEKAVFYAEYQYINSTGQSGHSGMLFAEILSCFKRTLARLLVIIVSLGFGIVKPRLGPALHRVIGIGALYFTLCSVEGWLRVIKPKNDPSNQTLMAEIPLAVLDSGICWWIFSSLVQTTRTLRLRRNVVKLGLYRHFTNTLIFSVLASVVYMSWSLYNHKLTNCITDWKELWVDEAYWHLLFSLLLMVIMILWRPTNNNQRYAFTPLLDAMEDEEDLLEKEPSSAVNDIYGTKARGNKIQSSSVKKEQKNATQDEDLKWVDENIPSSLSDTALPSLLDSDEEIMTVRFERNKME